MLTLFRWLLRATVAALVLAGLAAGLVWYFAIRSIPPYAAQETITGLTAPVEVVRSIDNVPHIMAQADRDAFLALGYVHAQDRLFQMTVLRRTAQGRLAEIFGPRALATDDLMRRLELAARAEDSLAALDARTREALEAYAEGVNAWVQVVNRDALGRGAPEMFLYPDTIAWWQPADSLAILKLWALASTQALSHEVMAARLSLALPGRGPQLLAHPGEPAPGDYGQRFAGLSFPVPGADEAGTDDWPDRLLGFLGPGTAAGGGVWAVPPEQTAAGGAILANDLQTGLTAPGLYYLARMELASGGVIGVTIPGVPAVISGRNPRLAWGIAPSGADDQDLFIEELQPGRPTRHRGPTNWTDFTERTEIIRVRDGEPRRITLRGTGNGPVLPGAHFGIRDILPAGHVASLGWPGLARDDTTLAGLIGLMRAGSTAQGLRAAQELVSPPVSLMLADGRGIHATTAGRLPLRGADGRLPTPGWDGARIWQGWAPPVPASTTPTTRMQVALARPGLGGTRPTRLRLAHLSGDREIHSRESLTEQQIDTVSGAARQLLPVVGADLWFTGDPAPAGTPERQRQEALALLAAWDGRMSEHLPEPLIYATWMAELQDRLIRDELGPLAAQLRSPLPDFIEAVFRNTGGAGAWCDVVQSAVIEDCTTIARQSLDAAILSLSERFGRDIASWRWGDAHQALHVSPGFGGRPLLGWLANLRHSLSGDGSTLAQAGLLGQGRNPWQAVSGAGYRAIYDLSDPDSSIFVTTTGQSGHLLSRHYDNLGELWRRGEYIGMSLDPDLARAAATGVTRLVPGE